MKREAIILEEVENKHILDIGSVGQTDDYSLWNLYKTVKLFSLTGIDLEDSENTAKVVFNKKEFDRDERVITGNAETYQFDRKFDVIVAGDVIEHMSNPGLFLDNSFKHLETNGKLVITTPNAKWWTVIFRPNRTHVLWHDKYTLTQLLERHNYAVEKMVFYPGNKKYYSPFVRLMVLKQGLIVICKRKVND